MIEALAQLEILELASHYVVVFLRVLGIFLFLPILGSELLPIRVRLALTLVLAFAFLPLAPRLAQTPPDALAWAIVATRELSVGLGLGLAAKMIFGGIEGAAGILAGQSGFALANMVDPTSGDQALAPTLFQNLVSIALFLAADLHHLFIRAILASYELVPAMAAPPSFSGLGRLVGLLGARLFGVAIELAAPALIVTVLVDLVLGLVGRAMPQVPILLVGYPIKLAAGLVAIALLVSTTGAAVGWVGRTIAADGATVMAAFGRG